jgi:hypothetical protein
MSGKTYVESSREINVFKEVEVLVIGAGPGGMSAAIAAAREGADTLLVERYGHLGGMATGGLVLMYTFWLPGQCTEWRERLKKLDGIRFLSPLQGLGGGGGAAPGPGPGVSMADPELLKCILNDMASEAGVKLLLHSWATQAIVEDNAVKGVIFESKSGRQAIMGKVVIDATGDGDIFATAGAEFDGYVNPKLRTCQVAVVFRIANIDWEKFAEFRSANPEKWAEMRKEVDEVAGFHLGPIATSRNDVTWINNFLEGYNILDVEDLTKVEVTVRKSMLPVKDYFKKNLPGFENSFLFDSAPQTGTRGSRRLIGEYIFTVDDMKRGATFEDAVIAFENGAGAGPPQESAPKRLEMPYRCLVPKSMDGLLVAGRNFSSDTEMNTRFNIIQPSIAMGQAAGTAAALAVQSNVEPRKVDYKALRKRLAAQGIPV